MDWRYIIHTVGLLILLLGLTMTAALPVGLYDADGSVSAMLLAVVITTVAGFLMYLGQRGESRETVSIREGVAIVSLGWVAVSFFGALPFYLGIESCSFTDAFFESTSGFTTTGASILQDVESISKSLLLWRSLIQWLGGMGIIVLSLAILPFLKAGGMQLYKAEVPSPVPDKLKPRIKETAAILWKVYALLTIIQVVLLLLGGMSLFESICHAFTTLPTGGFSTRNASLAHYQSVYLDVVVIVFMLLAGINFTLHYQLLRGKPLSFWRDAECRFYLLLLSGLTLVVSLNIYRDVYASIGQSLRLGAFQVVSIITTTGYATADYCQWPAMSQLILLMCMFIGASAGSTGGGMKCLRILLLCKYCYRELFTLVHPKAVARIKIGGKSVPDTIVTSVIGFLALYMGLFAVSTILLAGLGVDFITSLGAVAASIGNIGPGFGLVGPIGNYAEIPAAGKWLLAWCMLLGRLEIYTFIIFVTPEFWRK
jgi:trk system potassium uptake protein TrkH